MDREEQIDIGRSDALAAAYYETVSTRGALDVAVHGLERRNPAWSARRRVSSAQMVWLAACGVAAIAVSVLAPRFAFDVLHWLFFGLFAAAILLRAGAAIASLLTPRTPALASARDAPDYALLVPLYREAAIVADTIAAMRALEYPAHRLDLMLILEADDFDTIKAARAALSANPGPGRLVLVPAGGPRTKPKALNYALTQTNAPFVGVYDAEDRPHPQQLRAALAAFASGRSKLGCVQAPLLIDNARAGWIAQQFSAEYAIHFHQLVPFLCRLGVPPPLGGTSNHFRRAALDDVGAWDPFNVTEDADLGYRLARCGYRIGAITPPTFEEAPATLDGWMRQRTRWLKGHLQTWMVLMRDPQRTAREMGTAGFWAMQLVLAGGLLAAFAHAPLLLWALLALTPGIGMADIDWWLLAAGYSIAWSSAACAAWTTRNANILTAAITMPFYWPLAFWAGLRALIEFVLRPHYWAKTDHALTARDPPPCPRSI